MYADIVARIYNKAKAVSGILASSQYEPTTISQAPHLYTMLVSVQRQHLRGAVKLTYRTRIRVLAPYEESASAETVLWGFVNTIPAAVETMENDHVAESSSGFYTIGGRAFRALDLLVDTIETMPVGTG